MKPITCPLAQRLKEGIMDLLCDGFHVRSVLDGRPFSETLTTLEIPEGHVYIYEKVVNDRWDARRFRIQLPDLRLTWFELEKNMRFPSEIHQWWIEKPTTDKVVEVLLRLS